MSRKVDVPRLRGGPLRGGDDLQAADGVAGIDGRGPAGTKRGDHCVVIALIGARLTRHRSGLTVDLESAPARNSFDTPVRPIWTTAGGQRCLLAVDVDLHVCGAATQHPETRTGMRSEEHTSELHHGYISYAVFCLKKKRKHKHTT